MMEVDKTNGHASQHAFVEDIYLPLPFVISIFIVLHHNTSSLNTCFNALLTLPFTWHTSSF